MSIHDDRVPSWIPCIFTFLRLCFPSRLFLCDDCTQVKLSQKHRYVVEYLPRPDQTGCHWYLGYMSVLFHCVFYVWMSPLLGCSINSNRVYGMLHKLRQGENIYVATSPPSGLETFRSRRKIAKNPGREIEAQCLWVCGYGNNSRKRVEFFCGWIEVHCFIWWKGAGRLIMEDTSHLIAVLYSYTNLRKNIK